MAKRRTSGGPASAVPTENHSISVRKIENGYIVARSGHDPKRGWRQTETYHEAAPAFETAKPGRRHPRERSPLSHAKSHLKSL